MKPFLLVFIAAATLFAGGSPQSFTGTITDSMCVGDHAMMHITPDTKCVRDCVRSDKTVKYVLFDGKNAYKLSDQETPSEFAARKVKVTGILFPKTSIIQVQKIEPIN